MSKTAQKFYDERFFIYLQEGDDPGLAAEKADVDLAEWSQPLELPSSSDFSIEEMWS